MKLPATQLALSALLAFGAAAGAYAQGGQEQTVLPVWNNNSGQLEALLVLEPAETGAAAATTSWRFGNNRLDASVGLNSGNSLGLLCNRQTGMTGALESLVNNCMLATLDDGTAAASSPDAPGRQGNVTAALNRPGARVGLSVGETSGNLPAWIAPANTGSNRIDGNNLTVFAQKSITDQGYVSIAGSVAKARLIPYAQVPAGLADQWDSRSLSIGGGYGNFSANIIGQVIDTPNQERWEGLGLGITWRTPWSGQLTIGADNVVTRGRSPFASGAIGAEDEGAIPYVRYEQDL